MKYSGKPAPFVKPPDCRRAAQEEDAAAPRDPLEVRPARRVRPLGLRAVPARRHARGRPLRHQQHAHRGPGPRRGHPAAAHRAPPASSGRRWGRGSPTAWAPRTATCPASSRSPRRAAHGGVQNYSQRVPAGHLPGHGDRHAPTSRSKDADDPLPRQRRRSAGDAAAAARPDPAPEPRAPASARRTTPQIEGMVESYELAFRMQSAAPRCSTSPGESEATAELYGIGTPETDDFGRQCLLARRFAEAGVRFIQISTGYKWDQHEKLVSGHEKIARAVDRPIAGLLDRPEGPRAARRHAGLLGRRVRPHAVHRGRTTAATTTPRASRCGWPAAACKAGIAHGETDEFGFAAVEDKVHMHDLHATILHLLGPRPRAADLPLLRPRLPPDRRLRPGGARHPGLTPRKTHLTAETHR